MYSIAPALGHLQQMTQYDCWHASLRMMTKWKNGVNSEPSGTQTTWLYLKCRDAQAGFDVSKQNALNRIAAPDEIDHGRTYAFVGKHIPLDYTVPRELLASTLGYPI